MFNQNYGLSPSVYNPVGTGGYNNPSNDYFSQPAQTNKILVNGLDDALSRIAPRNSEIVYFDNNLDLMYIVQTDSWGKKKHLVLEIRAHEEKPPVEYVDKETFDKLVAQVEALKKED